MLGALSTASASTPLPHTPSLAAPPGTVHCTDGGAFGAPVLQMAAAGQVVLVQGSLVPRVDCGRPCSCGARILTYIVQWRSQFASAIPLPLRPGAGNQEDEGCRRALMGQRHTSQLLKRGRISHNGTNVLLMWFESPIHNFAQLHLLPNPRYLLWIV